MTDINLQSIVSKNDAILSSVVDEETVLLSIEDSKYYGIDPIGSTIWELLEKPHSIKEIIATMQEMYDVPGEQCKTDVITFINHLIANNLVQLESV